MNKKLLKILEIIQQSEKIDAEQKDNMIKAVKDVDKELEITAFKLERTEKVKKTTAILLEETIEELEQKRKAVEAQNHELEIESSLEKVRAVAMGMNTSQDLLKICEVSFKEFHKLGFHQLRNAIIHIPNDEQKCFMDYDYSEITGGAISKIGYGSHPIVDEYLKKIKSSKDAYFEVVIREDQLKGWKEFRKKTDQKYDPRLEDATALYYYLFSIGIGDIGISTFKPINESQLKILKRFRNVFDLAYKRYTDITQAEAQAKEAQIEAALEKVRSRSLAMQNSDEIKDVVVSVMEKMDELNIQMNGGVSLATFEPGSNDLIHWYVNPDHVDGPVTMHLPYFDNILFHDFIQARKSVKEILPVVYSFEEKNEYFQYAFEHSDFRVIPEELKKWILEQPCFGYSVAIQKHSAIFFNDYTGKLFSKEENEILIRFAKVFEQAYVRFLDLQKAEAQAREAQIEAALERVRSRSMGMQKSDELKEVIQLVYDQFIHLKINVDHAGFVVDYIPKGEWHFWIADERDIPSKITHPYFESVWANQFNEAKEKGVGFFATNLNFEEKNKFYNELLSYVPGLPDSSVDFYLSCPGLAISTVLLENVGLYIENFSGAPYSDEENKILMRFGKVFQQTYTRFLDLKKAEAQARETVKQAALDRIRGEIASMRTSEDLNKITPIVWRELKTLEVPFLRCGVFIVDEENENVQVYLTTPEGKPLGVLNLSFDANKLTGNTVDHWKSKQVYKEHWNKEEFINWTKSMMKLGQVQNAETYQGSSSPPESLHLHFIPFTQGMLYVGDTSPLAEDKLVLVKTLAEAFSIAYARYEDFNRVENAYKRLDNLSTELRIKNEALESENNRKAKELEEARQLQLSMLPKELPKFPKLEVAVYMKTATEVGGDYYDFNIGPDGTFTAAIGDATGHGMKAGTIVSMIKALFDSNSSRLDMKNFFDQSSATLKGIELGRLMMAFMMVKIFANKLQISNAGMPPIYLYKKALKSVEEIQINGMPLGAIKNFPYEIVEKEISSGDTILLLSDGLPELKNPSGELYNYERVKESFQSVAEKRPEKIIEYLKDEGTSWLNGREPDDDVSFVIIKIK